MRNLSLVIIVLVVVMVTPRDADGQADNCQTHRGEVNVVKKVFVDRDGGAQEVQCSARLAINKCEGTCSSQVSPSARIPRGFRKECNCCREGSLISRTVSVNECFDAITGVAIPDLQPTIILQEPSNCSCQECPN